MTTFEPGAKPDAAAQSVLDAEREFLNALSTRNFDLLATILHPELRYIHSNALVETHDEYLHRASTLHYDYEIFETWDIHLKLFSDTAITSGKMRMFESTAGCPKRWIPLQYVHVWWRAKNKWQLAFRQTTRLPE